MTQSKLVVLVCGNVCDEWRGARCAGIVAGRNGREPGPAWAISWRWRPRSCLAQDFSCYLTRLALWERSPRVLED